MHNTVVRAVTFPVETPLDESWDAVNDAIRVAFRLSTDLANWAVHRLFRLDAPGAKLSDAAAKCYLYGDAAKEFPEWEQRTAGVTQSAQCVFRAVNKKYLQDRFAIQVMHESALLTYRYPFPFPIHNAAWSVSFAKGWWPGEAPVIRLALPVIGRVQLRLSRGPEFARQLAMVRQFIDGTAKKGEAAIYRDRKGRLLVKMVGHFPRRERGDTPNVAFIHTDPNALLLVEINGRSANVTNADHIKRHIAKHKTMLQRTREDKKREVRMDRKQRKNLNKYVGTRCDKQNDRMDTYVKQVAAQVRGMCERQRVGLVAYDDTNKAFMPDGFPWHALKERLQQLLGKNKPGEEVTGELGCGWIDGQFAHLKEPQEKESWLTTAKAALETVRKVVAHKSRPAKKSHPAVSRPPAITST